MKSMDPQPQESTAPPPGTPVIADVFAKPKAGGGVDFKLDWRFQGENNPRGGPIDIPQKKCGEPGTMIHFHLRDETDRKLEFNIEDPIWVSRSSCPQDPSKDSEIPADHVNGHPNLLKVFDTNSDECDLRYALVFKDRDGATELFDPMIRNGGTI